jgi:hypothetical protein
MGRRAPQLAPLVGLDIPHPLRFDSDHAEKASDRDRGTG